MATIIPYLPEHLQVVPPGPLNGQDPDADLKRARYLEWRDLIYRYRVQRQHEVANDPRLVPLELHFCQDFGYWLSMYGTIFEPRDDRNALGGGNLPYIPFAKQIDMANFFFWVLTQRGPDGDGVVSKSRDVGASWMICAIALHGWLFKGPWNVLLVSRKEELVDSKNHRSLFAKIDRLYWGLPAWMRPEGYDPDRHRQKLFMLNPVNHNELAGESTTGKTGRADRATWGAFDEAALIPELLNTWNGVAATMGHRFAVSTEHLDEGDDFYNLRTGIGMDDRPALFEIDWWDNPLNDQAWFDNEKRRYSSRPSDFEREVLRNPHAGASTWVYGQLRDPKFFPDVMLNDPVVMASTYVTMDPGKLDDFAITVIQTHADTGYHVILDSYQNKGMDADFYGTILSANPDEAKYPGKYGPKEQDFMQLLRDIPNPTYCGDTYGDASNGVTLDTWYTVFGRYTNPQGTEMSVQRDRLNQKDKGMYAKAMASFRGRQQSVNDLIQQFRFSGRPGARFAYECMTKHRNKPQDRPMMSEPATPLHDWTSHIVTSVEFWAVYVRTRTALSSEKPKPIKAATYKPAGLANLRTPGANKQRSTLYRPAR